MIQGSNHARTKRRATGQHTCGRTPFPSLIFFPRPHWISRNVCRFGHGWLRSLLWCVSGRGAALRGVIPTKGKGTTDQLPVPPDGAITSHLILRPTQRVLDLLVTLLHPLAQSI